MIDIGNLSDLTDEKIKGLKAAGVLTKVDISEEMNPERAVEIIDEFLQLENPIETELEKALKTAAEFIRKEPRAKGHWEEKKEYSYSWLLRNMPYERLEQIKCSVCGRWCEHTKGNIPNNFCPNCGADMRGEQNEN